MPRVRSKRGSTEALFSIDNMGRGLNNFVADILVDDKESPDASNIQIDESGLVKKRNGWAAVADNLGTATGVSGLGTYYSGTSTKETVCVYNTSAYKRTTGNWSAISGGSFTAGIQSNFVQGSDTSTTTALYFHNGTDAMTKYNGSVLSTPAGGKTLKFGINYLRRHMAAGDPTKPSRLYYSGVDDTDNLTNTWDIGGNDGQMITGLGKFQNNLIVFKERSIYQFTFDSSGNPVVVLINGSVGCVSHRSIENVENDLFFLSRKGVYVLGNEPNFFDTIRTNELSIRVKTTIDTISTANFSLASAIYYNNRYHLSIPSGGTSVNNKTLAYDRRYLAWELWDFGPSAWTEFIDSTNALNLYWGSTAKGQIYALNTNYSDDGVAISAYHYTKNYDLGLHNQYKQFLWVDLTFRQLTGSVTIDIIIDGTTISKTVTLSSTSTASTGQGSRQWAAPQWGAGTGAVSGVLVSSNTPERIRLNKKGRLIKIKVTNNNLNETFALMRLEIAYRPYGRQTFPSNLKLS